MRTLSVLLLLSLLSCQQKSSSSKNAPQETPVLVPVEQERPVEIPLPTTSQFMTEFKTLNDSVTGRLTGSVTIIQDIDKVIADVRFSGGPASVVHAQNIYEGTTCPGAIHDVNADGFIDEYEMSAVVGKIIIPLDGDLSSQDSGAGLFPVADQYGNYVYSQIASYERFMLDLSSVDVYPEDLFVKLTGTRTLDLTGRVVILQGVPETATLPASVRSRSRANRNQTLPIACGIISKISHSPGVIDSDETTIPAPEGGSVGGSSGADDGTDLIVSGASDGTTTGGVSTGETTTNEVPDEHLGGTTGVVTEPLPEEPQI